MRILRGTNRWWKIRTEKIKIKENNKFNFARNNSISEQQFGKNINPNKNFYKSSFQFKNNNTDLESFFQ